MNLQTSYPITGEKVKKYFFYIRVKDLEKIQGPKLKNSFMFSANFDDFNAKIKSTPYDIHVS